MNITLISPTKGHTGGRTLVEIKGTGFREPSPPVEGVYPVEPSPPSVRVLFGGVPAIDVAVESTSCVFAVSPMCELPMASGPDGDDLPFPATVDITVENIDDDGNLIPGEQVVVPNAFEYLRPDLNQHSHGWSVMQRFYTMLKLQIHKNVSYAVHSDFGGFGSQINLAYTARLPAIMVLAAAFRDSEIRRQGPQLVKSNTADQSVRKQELLELDLLLELLGVSDSPDELGKLLLLTRAFFQKNKTVRVPRDPLDPSAGTIEYTLDFSWGTEMRVTMADANSNLANFTVSCGIRNILLEEMPCMAPDGTTRTADGVAHEGSTAPIHIVDEIDIAKERFG